MNNAEAKALLKDHLANYRLRSYNELLTLLDDPQVIELRSTSGSAYQVEVNVLWDDCPGGDLRVIGCIDDGGWRALVPISDDFIMAPDGHFVDE